jgi:hypothetical protein
MRTIRPILVLLLAAVMAHAEDPAPKDELSAALDALPAPSEDEAFAFEGVIRLGERELGTFRQAAEVATTPSGEKGWRIREQIELMGGQQRRTSSVLLDRRLQPISGESHGETTGKPAESATWTRTSSGLKVVRKTESVEETLDTAYEGDVLTSTTALWLFGLLRLPAEGSYEALVFQPLPGPQEEHFEQARWSLVAGETWRIEGKKGDTDVEAAFDPTSHALVRAVFRGEGRPDIVFEPKAREGGTEDPFAAPASSAENAALTAALCFATGDVEHLENLVHWPTVYEEARKGHEAKNAGVEDAEPFPDAASWRAQVLESLAAQLPKNPRPMIEQGLAMARGQLRTEEIEGGLTRVTFPEMFRSMAVDVGEREGKWYLMRFPSR